MKSLLLPAAMALAVHALILGLDVEWRARSPHPVPAHRVLTLALNSYRPETGRIPPVPKPPEPEPLPNTGNATSPKKAESPRRPHRQASKEKVEPPRAGEQEPLPSSMSSGAEPLQAVGTVTEIRKTDMTPLSVPEDGGSHSETQTASLSPAPVLREAHPAYRKNPAPIYPQLAKRRGLEGTVLLEVLVGSEGAVKNLRVFRSSGHDILDQTALDAVRRWVFEPGRRGEEAMEMWVKVPIRFELK